MRLILYISLVFYIIGVIIGQCPLSLNGIVLSSIFMLSASTILYKKYKLLFVFIFPVLTVLGCVRFYEVSSPSSYILEDFSEKHFPVEVCATIYDLGNTYNDKCTIFISSDCISRNDFNIEANINMKATVPKSANLDIGDKIKLKGNLTQLDSRSNPGGFDEKLYYKTRFIEYKIYSSDVSKIGTESNCLIDIKKFNKKICDIYDEILPKEEASLIKAIIAGDKSDLSETTKNLFSEAGIYHIIAISGLHIHIFSGIILFITEKFHRKYGKTAAVILILLYCIFSGASISAVRATIMALIYIFGKFIYRNSNVLNSLAISGFLILFFNPLYLFDIGFQYSFGAVLSIVIFSKPIEKILKRKISSQSAKIIAPSIAVLIITKGLVWFHFYNVSLIDVFVNLIIIPFAGILIFFGFISGLLGLISYEIAMLFSSIVYYILKLYRFVCQLAVNTPFSYILIGKMGIITAVLYFFAVILFALKLYKIISKRFFIVCFSVLILLNFTFSKNSEEFKITMLNVGQGDCFVFNHFNKCFVIDGGGSLEKDLGSDTGIYVLLPYLKYMGVDEIEAIFVTHMDADHVKGIIEILDYVDVDKIYVSNLNTENHLCDTLVEKANNYDIEIVEIFENNKIEFDDNITVECLYPFEKDDFDGNASSLVLRISHKNNKFLFTGDIDSDCERKIINSNKNIDADVLKLAHHGSKYSNCEEFINAVNPKIAIVSAGNYNRYGHPAKEVLQKLNERNIKVLNTNESGAVEIYSDGNRIYFETMK